MAEPICQSQQAMCTDCGKCVPSHPACCTTCPAREPGIKREEPNIAPWPECQKGCDSYEHFVITEAISDIAHAYIQLEAERDSLTAQATELRSTLVDMCYIAGVAEGRVLGLERRLEDARQERDQARASAKLSKEREDMMCAALDDATEELDNAGLANECEEVADGIKSLRRERDKAVEALRAIRGYTREHDQQSDHVAWHRLKVDIPAIINEVLGPDPDEPVSEFAPEVDKP